MLVVAPLLFAEFLYVNPEKDLSGQSIKKIKNGRYSKAVKAAGDLPAGFSHSRSPQICLFTPN